MNSQSIPNTIHTCKFPYYKPSQNETNTLKEQTGKADAYINALI